VLLQDRSAAVAYRGTWNRSSSVWASGGTITSASSSAASARTSFSGRAVAIVGATGHGRGHARLYVDGVYRWTMNFWSSVGQSRQVLWTAAWPTLGTHTVELRPVGDGTADLDAFVILR
jgi:hypothetical protein